MPSLDEGGVERDEVGDDGHREAERGVVRRFPDYQSEDGHEEDDRVRFISSAHTFFHGEREDNRGANQLRGGDIDAIMITLCPERAHEEE